MSKVVGFFSRVALPLTQLHPLWFMVTYLGAIPLFAGLYLTAPQGFYAPYSRYEPYALEDRKRLVTDIMSSTRRSLSNKNDEDFKKPRCSFERNFLQVQYLETSDVTKPTFLFGLPCLLEAGGTFQMVVIEPSEAAVKLKKGDDIFFYHFLKHTVTGNNAAEDWKSIDSDLMDLLFEREARGKGDDYETTLSGPLLALNAAEEKDFRDYIEGVGGNPVAISGSYFRMLYLSAVVITTLGLGDIVPITTTARTLIAIEAIFGIVLAGLFLNSVAYRASKRNSDSES